jgi:D-alanine-D-alanine ligase
MNIGVFFGSRNTEHDISIITGELIISGLKGLGHSVMPIYIDKEGHWLIGKELGSIKKFTGGEIKEDGFKRYFLDIEQSVGKMVFRKKGLGGKSITVDLAFPALHGAYGEDGAIQGLFEMLHVPYVGCNVVASAIAMDKALTKKLCLANNIPTTKFVDFTKDDWEKGQANVTENIKKSLKFPVFVKPVHGGSSIGIAKINDSKELDDKVEVALYYDNKVVVEEGVSNLMDVTCCVIGNDDLEASLLQESVFRSDLFDFEEKYLKAGGSQLGKSESGLVIPARLDEKTTKEIQDTAKKVYKALGCTGITRVDFLYDKKSKEFFANEVNPMPGTLYHHLWQKSGIELPELLKKLISYAKEAHEEKQSLSHTFKSSVLTNLKSSKLGSNKLKQ